MRYLVSWHVEVEAEDAASSIVKVISRARYSGRWEDAIRDTDFTVLNRENGETTEIQIDDDGKTREVEATEEDDE